VLGEMFELGAGVVDAHRQVGVKAVDSDVDVLVTVGEMAAHMAAAASEQETWHGEAVVTAGRDEALEWLRHNVSAADVVLVKASRGAALEVLAHALTDTTSTETPAEGSSTP
jgi:UDP-N-acetylmuramoyl-tripeptide--D-alanyl-D-alanine ligase